MYIFIVNPIAGHGKAKRIFNSIIKSDLYKQIDSSYYYTNYNGHAEKIAKQIAEQKIRHLQAIIVISGDGTLHEVINGIKGHHLPLAFIPGGSGNDFARGLHIQEQPLEIFEKIVNDGKIYSYWVGNYQVKEEEERHFVNSIGVGFDAAVAKHANHSLMKKLLNKLNLGKFSYLFALIYVLIQFKPFSVQLEVDGKKQQIDRCLMLSIGNHPYYGGGLKMFPNAKIQPHSFPLLMIHSVSKMKILALFLTVLWGGHVKLKEVTIIEAKHIKIASNNKLYYQVDGETFPFQSCTITKSSQPIHILGVNHEKFNSHYERGEEAG